MILDAIAEAEEVQVSEQDLLQYLVQASRDYGMQPNDFIKAVDESGQVPAFVAEVARRKALAVVLQAAVITDAKGNAVDIAAFISDGASVEEGHEGHDH
jgi:trigger factor